MKADKPVLSMEHVEKSFGDNTVLKDVSLSVEKGEVVSIIGSSGGGKSTLLRCATLLETFERGTLSYGDLDVVTAGEGGKAVYGDKKVLKQAREHFGLVFQNFNLFPHYTVLKNVMDAPVRVQKRDKAEAEEAARDLLAKFGLAGKEDMVPCELSGGQQQRVAIARALATKPSLFLADEPTGNLDSRTGQDIMDLFHRVHADGNTIVLITHDESVAAQATRSIHILDGRIVDGFGPAASSGIAAAQRRGPVAGDGWDGSGQGSGDGVPGDPASSCFRPLGCAGPDGTAVMPR